MIAKNKPRSDKINKSAEYCKETFRQHWQLRRVHRAWTAVTASMPSRKDSHCKF